MKAHNRRSTARFPLAILAIFWLAGTQAAGPGMQHMEMHDNEISSHHMPSMKEKMFLVKKSVDGYSISFHIMQAPKGNAAGQSHHLMFKVEQNGTILTALQVNSKVIAPGGHAQSHPMMNMGDWFMAGYDLGQKGRYQVLVLFKTPDGRKHKAGVYYP